MQFKLMLFTKSKFRTAVLLVLCFLCAAAPGFAQVTLTLKNTPLTKVFKEIQKQTGYEFLGNYEMLEKAGNVTISVNNVSAKDAVEASLKGKGLGYELQRKVFVIKPLSVPAKSKSSSLQFTVDGKVVDEKSEPLPGATIAVMDLKRSVSANKDGKFILSDLLTGYNLQISCVGYETKMVTIRDSSPLLIVLQESTQKLKEVVLVGYGQQKKINLTGSIATVTDKELNENHSSAAVSDMLAGQISGLYVQKSNGAPGAGSDLKVRGLSTFNNSSPLVVIDGIPGRNIDDLNPADIQAVSVLKDAAAIAVYGARASNGVILVTTKKGVSGKPEITFSSNLINQVPTQIYKRVDSYQYAMIQNEALQNEHAYNPSLGLGYTPEQLQLFKDGSNPDRYPNTDWFKTLTKPSVLQASYNLTASGGNEDTRYFVSAGYVKNSGIIPIEAYKRWNLRSNLSANITPRLKLDLNLAGIFVKQDGQDLYGGSYIMKQIYGTPPIRVNQFSNGLYAQVPEQRGNAYLQSIGQGGFNTVSTNTFNSTLSLQYEVPGVKGLFAKGTAAYDKGYSFGKSFTVPYDVYTVNGAGNFSKAAYSVR